MRPDYESLSAAAKGGNKKARKDLESWSERERARKRLAAVMGSARVAVIGYEGVDGELVRACVSSPLSPSSPHTVRRGTVLPADSDDPLDRDLWREDEPALAAPVELERLLGPVQPVSPHLPGEGSPTRSSRAAREAARAARRRVSVEALALDEVGDLLVVEGRAMRDDWLADPARTADRVGLCCSTATVFKRSSGSYGAAPIGCGVSVCPQCARAKGGDWISDLHPMCVELARGGCTPVHVTLTQRGDMHGDRPTLLTAAEYRMGYRAPAPLETADGRHVGYAVPGASLSEAVETLLGAFRGMRNKDRAGSRFWSDTVAGYIYAIEATGRSYRCEHCRGEVAGPRGHCKACKKDSGAFLPRWHVHLHVLAMVRPGVEVPLGEVVQVVDRDTGEPTGRTVRRACQASGWLHELSGHWLRCLERAGGSASRSAQVGTLLSGTPEEVADALAEVIKYPAKVSTLTRAQVLEWLACRKGVNHHLSGGCFHASSNIGKAMRLVESSIEELDRPTVDADLVDCIVDALLDEDEPPAYLKRLPEWGGAVIAALIRARSIQAGDVSASVYVPSVDDVQRPTDKITAGLGTDPTPIRWSLLTVDGLERRIAALGAEHDVLVGVPDQGGGVEVHGFVRLGAILADVTTWRALEPSSREAEGDP